MYSFHRLPEDDAEFWEIKEDEELIGVLNVFPDHPDLPCPSGQILLSRFLAADSIEILMARVREKLVAPRFDSFYWVVAHFESETSGSHNYRQLTFGEIDREQHPFEHLTFSMLGKHDLLGDAQ